MQQYLLRLSHGTWPLLRHSSVAPLSLPRTCLSLLFRSSVASPLLFCRPSVAVPYSFVATLWLLYHPSLATLSQHLSLMCDPSVGSITPLSLLCQPSITPLSPLCRSSITTLLPICRFSNTPPCSFVPPLSLMCYLSLATLSSLRRSFIAPLSLLYRSCVICLSFLRRSSDVTLSPVCRSSVDLLSLLYRPLWYFCPSSIALCGTFVLPLSLLC